MAVGALVLVGGSAGGIEPLGEFLAGLPADLPATVLVVVHRSAHGETALHRVLARRTSLSVALARDGEALRAGNVRVAAPDLHLVVDDGTTALLDGPQENRHRPAVDALLRSASRWYGPRCVAVVLSGALDDGAVGAALVAMNGGTVLVQDPDEALVPAMPAAALAAVPDAVVATATGLAQQARRAVARILEQAARSDGGAPAPGSQPLMTLSMETTVTQDAGMTTPVDAGLGVPTGLGCPDCSGGMYEVRTGAVIHYRCHTGDAWSPMTLLQAERDAAENGLLAAAAKLREEAVVRRRLADLAAARGEDLAARTHLEEARTADDRAVTVHRLLRRLTRTTSTTGTTARP